MAVKWVDRYIFGFVQPLTQCMIPLGEGPNARIGKDVTIVGIEFFYMTQAETNYPNANCSNSSFAIVRNLDPINDIIHPEYQLEAQRTNWQDDISLNNTYFTTNWHTLWEVRQSQNTIAARKRDPNFLAFYEGTNLQIVRDKIKCNFIQSYNEVDECIRNRVDFITWSTFTYAPTIASINTRVLFKDC